MNLQAAVVADESETEAEQRPLPEGWAWSTLGELGDIVGGVTVDKKRSPADPVDVPYLRVANVQRGFIDLSEVKTIRVERNVAQRLALQKNDILLNEGGDRDKIGRGWVWQDEINPCIHQNHVFRVRFNHEGINPFFISYYANEIGRPFFIEQGKQTTNLASISMSKIRQLPIPVAPPAEQRRIVGRIDELFAEIAEGEAALKSARQGLDLWRRSLLKAAVTGELTRDWRETHKPVETGADLLARIRAERQAAGTKTGRGRRSAAPAPLDTSSLPDLPEGWVWATVGDIVDDMEYGTSVKCETEGKGAPVLRMGNIQDGMLDISRLKYADRVTSDTLPLLLNGDILFNRTNSAELVGKSAVFRGQISPCSFASYLIRLRPHQISPDFIVFWLSSVFGKKWVADNKSQQVGQANLSGGKLKMMPIPIPPAFEQDEIVKFVKDSLSARDDMEIVSEKSAADSRALRQSILKAAFEGRLVPQDPTEEPASALLTRIRGGGVAEPSPPRRRGRPPARP